MTRPSLVARQCSFVVARYGEDICARFEQPSRDLADELGALSQHALHLILETCRARLEEAHLDASAGQARLERRQPCGRDLLVARMLHQRYSRVRRNRRPPWIGGPPGTRVTPGIVTLEREPMTASSTTAIVTAHWLFSVFRASRGSDDPHVGGGKRGFDEHGGHPGR